MSETEHDSTQGFIAGFRITETLRGGQARSFWVGGCDTAIEAYGRTIEIAEGAGWHSPRWYEWWRWRQPDTRISRSQLRTLKDAYAAFQILQAEKAND